MATSPDEADCRARAFFRYVCDPAQATKESTFDRTALQYIDFDSVKAERPGHTYCEIVAVHAVCNGMGSLHGGCIATLVDTVGSAALCTVVDKSQVSTHISIDYLAPVPLGDTAMVEANVLQKGGRTGVIEVRIKCKSNGKLAATGIHHKYWTPHSTPLAIIEPKRQQSKL